MRFVVSVSSRLLTASSASMQQLQSSGAVCESRGGRPGLPVLMSLMVSMGLKQP